MDSTQTNMFYIAEHPIKEKYQNVLFKMKGDIENSFYKWLRKYDRVDVYDWAFRDHKKVEKEFRRESEYWSDIYIKRFLESFRYIKDIIEYVRTTLLKVDTNKIIGNQFYMFSCKGDPLLGTCLCFLKTYYGEDTEKKFLLASA